MVESRVVVSVRSIPYGNIDGPRLVEQLDFSNEWLRNPNYRLLRPAKFTLSNLEVNPVYVGPRPNTEEMKTHVAARRLREEIKSRAAGNVLAYSPPRLAALVLASAIAGNVNPARVTLKIDSTEEGLVRFLIRRLNDAANLVGYYILWSVTEAVGQQYIDDLIRMLEEAAARGQTTRLERLAINFITKELATRASLLRVYMDKVFGDTRLFSPGVASELYEAAEKARDPNAKRLAERLADAAKAYGLMLFDLDEITFRLRRIEDPAEVAEMLKKIRDILLNGANTIAKALEDAETILNELENESIMLSKGLGQDRGLSLLKA